jgi:hypothetical protein
MLYERWFHGRELVKLREEVAELRMENATLRAGLQAQVSNWGARG